jgi:TPR repeat protein
MSKLAARENLEKGCDLYALGDYQAAAEHFIAAAQCGSAEAQVNLANMYNAGKGVVESFSMAAYWYKRAARRGCCYGASGLGMAYLRRGQVRWGNYWLKKAVEMGDPWAEEDIVESKENRK